MTSLAAQHRPMTAGRPPMPSSGQAARPATAGHATTLTPMPPVLAYINEKLRVGSASPSRKTLSRPSTAASAATRPGTADALNKKFRRHRTFLKDNDASDTLLPQPLPNGIPYVAQFTTFDDLIDRKILSQTEEQQVHLSTHDVKLMYEAKCMDQELKPTWDREVRFMELLSSNCRGNFFCLRENGLGNACAEAIVRVLSHNDHYSIVDLSGNRFRDVGAQCLAQLLLLNESIVHLSLKSNDIGHDGGIAIAEALQHNVTLTSLDLGGISGINRNHLGSQGAAALGQMLCVNPVLAYLDVSSNGLGAEGIKLLSQGFDATAGSALVAVNLASNNLGPEGSAELGTAIELTKLEKLDLQRNALSDRGVCHIAHGLRSGTSIADTLTELFLDTNNIKEMGCKAIGRLLRGNGKLKFLSLSDNPIGANVKYICDALVENRSLQELRMSHCMILSGDCASIGSAISKTSTLTALDLSKNRIADQGAKAIFNAVTTNRSLLILDVASNAIANPGGECIAMMLKDNKTLEDLNIRQNLISTAGAAIEECLRRNTKIRKLDFSFNDFTFQVYTGVNSTLQRNQGLWVKEEVPRLTKEIESLGSAHTELFHIQEDIDAEKRGVREKTDECTRLRETINNNTDRRRRTLEELKEQVDAMQAEVVERETKLRTDTESTTLKIQKMEMKVVSLNRQLDNEREKKEKAFKDIERTKKALKTVHDSELEALKPLLEQYRRADNERNSDMADARWQAENLIQTEMKIAQLERALGLSSNFAASNDVKLGASSTNLGATASGSASPPRAGSAKPKRK